MKGISYYFLLFYIYAILGYFGEVLYVYFNSKKLVNRGFLFGPYIPIYGVGGIIVAFLLTGYYNDPIVVFFMTVIMCSALEYFTSYVMEKIFHNRWWDYSEYRYNINGRVCLKNSLIFGFAGLLMIYVANPIIYNFLDGISIKDLNLAAMVLAGIFTIDLIISSIEAFRINNISMHLELILNEYTKNKNIKLNRIKTRLLDAFPYLVKKNDRLIKRLKSLKKDFKRRKKMR